MPNVREEVILPEKRLWPRQLTLVAIIFWGEKFIKGECDRDYEHHSDIT